MNKKINVCLVGIGLILILGVIGMFLINDGNIFNEYKVTLKERIVCDNEAELYYEGIGRNYYTYCVDSIKVDGVELRDLLSEDENIIDDVIKRLGEGSLYDDGGSIMFSSENINLLRCNSLLGDTDIYLGNAKMGYESGFCGKTMISEFDTFTKTYLVLKVSDSNEYEYLDITVKQDLSGEVATVKVRRDVFDNYVVNNYYEFTFFKFDAVVEDNIKSVFDNTTLDKVVLSTKTGLNQINDEF